MILLQTYSQAGGPNLGAGTVDPKMFLFIGLAIVGVVALILIGALVSRRARPSATETAERISSTVFRREAKRVGLTGPAIDVLENLVRMCKVKQPLLVFSSASLLDDTL